MGHNRSPKSLLIRYHSTILTRSIDSSKGAFSRLSGCSKIFLTWFVLDRSLSKAGNRASTISVFVKFVLPIKSLVVPNNRILRYGVFSFPWLCFSDYTGWYESSFPLFSETINASTVVIIGISSKTLNQAKQISSIWIITISPVFSPFSVRLVGCTVRTRRCSILHSIGPQCRLFVCSSVPCIARCHLLYSWCICFHVEVWTGTNERVIGLATTGLRGVACGRTGGSLRTDFVHDIIQWRQLR